MSRETKQNQVAPDNTLKEFTHTYINLNISTCFRVRVTLLFDD